MVMRKSRHTKQTTNKTQRNQGEKEWTLEKSLTDGSDHACVEDFDLEVVLVWSERVPRHVDSDAPVFVARVTAPQKRKPDLSTQDIGTVDHKMEDFPTDCATSGVNHSFPKDPTSIVLFSLEG